MPKFQHPNLLVGSEHYDDAGVYKLRDDLVLIQTVDFFTPMVDDPYAFGQIAAANALSDIYAMGGQPLTAMNITAYPKCGNMKVLSQILLGGAEKVKEAEALLVGGHTVDDQEPKFGLAVTGTARPEEVLTNASAQPGDILVLTKKLGNGILATGLKAGMLDQLVEQEAIREMATLNKNAALAMKKAVVHAATDVTGFGFLGHLGEIVAASNLCARIWADRLPVWEEAVELAGMGIIPGGCYTNREYLAERVAFAEDVPLPLQDIMFDPQTSGGLLMAVEPQKTDSLTAALVENKVAFQIIGELDAGEPGKMFVQWKKPGV